MSKVKHTTIRNEKLFCLHCGGDYSIKFPIDITEMNKKIKSFNDLHSDCEKTWVEPNADQEKTIEERAKWWIEKGEVGLSSKTIYAACMGIKGVQLNYPHDPSDFGRCYKLFKAIPEWRQIRYKNIIANLHPKWSILMDNWDMLTEMYEQNVRESWENHENIGMFEFMQNLLNNATQQ